MLLLVAVVIPTVLSQGFNGGTAMDTRQSSAACPPPWTRLRTGCYLFEEHEPNSWNRAKEKCKMVGGSLVEIENQEEQDAIQNHMNTLGLQDMSFWIGLNDIGQEGSWVWEESQRLAKAGFTNWVEGEPDEYYGNEDCAVLNKIRGGWNPAQWSDVQCSHHHHSLCEKGGSNNQISPLIYNSISNCTYSKLKKNLSLQVVNL